MAITLQQAQQQLDAWLAASLAVSKGVSYRIGTRQLTRADASQIQSQITYWEAKVDRLTRGSGVLLTRIVPRDE
jgi:hypothetical protein